MTSSMLAGERRWASSRRGGMTVLGKVAVPKPINLPSQKLENHGLDPNVEIVPKGSLSWGSRSSSSTSNPWGSSALSLNADGTTVSPHHPSGRPSSGGGLSRPSTAGSDRHEPSATTWGPNSRPSSASGVLPSNQSALTSSRPLSSETRPGSSHLSGFAEPVYENSGTWGPNGSADKLSISSKVNDFSLSSGDFPTLGSEKDNTAKSGEPHDHASYVRPGSSSGRTAPAKERNESARADHKSGTVDTWTRDGSPNFEDGVHPNADKWQGDPHQYFNSNVPPQHYDAWRGPPMNASPGVWYRGPPHAGPPYPPVPHGGFPMEPFPYYRPQIPPPLPNSQSAPPPGPGPRGHHPRNGDFYRPQMPDAFIRPGMPVRPGFYPGPAPYDGYFGPPMGYNPNDRDMSFMGMPPGPPCGPPGPHGPPVYNMCQPPNPPELNDPHFRGGAREPVGNMFVSEKSDSIPPEESRGPYKVLRKRENQKDAEIEDNWEQNVEKVDQPRPSLYKTDTRRNEDMPSSRNTLTSQYSSEGPHKSKASNESWENKSSFQEDPKDSSSIQNIEGLNSKDRVSSDVQMDTEQSNELLNNPKGNSTIAFGSISITGDLSHHHDKSRQVHHGVRNQADHHNRGRLSNQDNDGWRKKPPFIGSEISAPAENPEIKNTGDSLTQVVDPADGQAQRAKMRELAKQRAIERQKEEEERIREQKAKAHAKLEELNRRALAPADGTTQTAEKTSNTVPELVDVDGSQKPTGLAFDDSKQEPVDQISEKSQQESMDRSLLVKQGVANATDAESKAPSLGNDGVAHRQKHASHKQKPSVQTVETLTLGDKSTLTGTGDTVINNPGSNLTVSGEALSSQEPTLPNSSNIITKSSQQKKRNNKISKNKHKLDDASASREVNLLEPNPSTMMVADSKDSKQSNLEQVSSLPSNQHKPQHLRRMPRNPQANRFHVGDVAVWAPVRAHNKEEVTQDDVALPEKSSPSTQTNLKSKRAEMERYVPKPVTKELDQQGNVNKSASPSSPKKTTLEDMTDTQPTVPVSVTMGPTVESKSGDNKQNKQVKSHGALRQRDQDLKKSYHKSTSQHEEVNPVPTETNVTHEWDPSDGWFMPDEYPITAVVKDEGGVTGKEKRPAYKGQRNIVKNHKDISGAEMEVDQIDRPPSSKENRSHWHPKPQQYKGGWSGGNQTSNSEVRKESRRFSSQVQPEEPVDGNQEGRREREPSSFKARVYSPNMEDEAQAQSQARQFDPQHHGFRKYGSQNNRSGGQDDKPRHNQHNANTNRDKPRQNLHYEYQPVGSNSNSNKFSSLDASADGSGNAGSRYKERSSGSGQGQSRRGGSNYYGRQ
ncbi:protein MODIFIER OF SNC1 1-like [Bidens hawaiensis]|uniref:protein MODIFIER OF SNC1 1-like n=1 Tax=Bidens hawaiensis TaxID=980011 RepID=UPI00404A7E5E